MNKAIIILTSILIILLGGILGMLIFTAKENEGANIDNTVQTSKEQEKENKNNIIETNSYQERLSPNCTLTLKTYYKECGHIKNEYYVIGEELVNKTKEDIEKVYGEYSVSKFSSSSVELYREVNNQCGEHYVVKNVDDNIEIYKLLESGEEILFEKTDISIIYLTEADKEKIRNGIEINGKEELNKFLEDYE